MEFLAWTERGVFQETWAPPMTQHQKETEELAGSALLQNAQ